MPSFYNQTVKDTLEKFNTDPDEGLSTREIERRRKKYGPNQLEIKDRSLIRKLLEPFIDIFMFILMGALALSAIQREWLDVTLIIIIIIINAVIFHIQQFSTNRILRSLRRSILQTVTVIRNGEETSTSSSDLVPGDIVILSEGDRVPADGRLIVESGLLANESMLTGESEPMAKNANKITGTRKVYEQTNMVFSGSFIVTGSGRMIVTATGNNSEYGRIASLASSVEFASPIQEKINKLVIKIAIVVVSLAVVVFAIQLIRNISILHALEFTLAMIVSAVPEGLPIAISVVLALGAKRMAAKKALIKEMRAIENIGIVTTIASDKTGTLTENKLSVKAIWSPSDNTDNLKRFVAESALPASASGDPLDAAIVNYFARRSPYLTDIGPVHSYPFDQDLKMSGNLFETRAGALNLAIKGAPEAILRRCKLSVTTRHLVESEISRMSAKGYKVIAVAKVSPEHEINELARLSTSEKFTFVGLVSIADSLRPESIPAIAAARHAGVSVKMITGDHVKTAATIGRELGIVTDEAQVLDCSRLGSISENDFDDLVRKTTVFARVTPEDKFKILSSLKRREVVAMTGDGVNDVPALTNAHIGISMGNSPSIVQDAGDIILINNNFKNIIEAVKEGRIILTNIRRMLVYLLATNAGEVLTIILALSFGGNNILFPIQILWINLVTDSLMVIPVGLEPPESYYLRAKPEPKDAPILSPTLAIRMAVIAITMAVIAFATYFMAQIFLTPGQANTLAFTSLVVAQWANAFNMRATHEPLFTRLKVMNKPFYITLAIAIISQIAVLVGPLSEVLRTVPVPLLAMSVVIITSFFIPIVTVELHKKLVSAKNTTKKA